MSVRQLRNGNTGPVDSSRPNALDVLHVDLDSSTSSPGEARKVVRDTLELWRMAGLVDVVQLVVSELVTNAVRHGRPPVHLSLVRRPEELCLEVHDGAAWEPTGGPRVASTDAESGRGLHIVAALASDVTVQRVPDDGTVVHARFAAPAPDLR